MTSSPGSEPSPQPAERSSSLLRAGLELGLVAALILFQELLLIRWVPGQVRVVAYFPNLLLIASFLGIGVGCLQAARRPLLTVWPLLLLLLVAVTWGCAGVRFFQASASEHLWLLYYDLPPDAPRVDGIVTPILGLFLLTAATFVPLGQALAALLRQFREERRLLRGYACDLLGSLSGIVLFTLLSFLRTFPAVWFTALLVAGLALHRRAGARALHAAAGAALLAAVVASEKAHHYSPYYAISDGPPLQSDDRVAIGQGATAPTEQSRVILTNGSLHQYAFPMTRRGELSEQVRTLVRGYHLPYELLGRPVRRVLVLGAGSGNDVAVALDRGAEHVDAVEIDPVIIEIGRRHHPNRPYDDPRVRVWNRDARAFLENTTERYDVVVFGTLDSMTHLSALSSVRLDNFVYTVEGMQAARRVLTQDGGVVLYFWVAAPFIDHHIQAILGRAFEEVPVVEGYQGSMFNQVYLAGPAFERLRARYTPGERRAFLQDFLPTAEAPTDDWPYLYLRERGISPFYLQLGGLLLVLSAVLALAASAELRTSLGRRADLEMFLFGAAFLLMEGRYVTTVSLLWGASWLTSAVVFGAVLLTLLGATLLTERLRLPWRLAFPALLLSLAVGWLLPPAVLLAEGVALRLLGTLLYVGVPVFFAAVCFALRFDTRATPDVAFGWNLLGACLGGLLEYGAMRVGLRGLFPVAIAAYVLTLAARPRPTATAG